MNTNPQAKRILCYGDSNTYGRISGPIRKRFPLDIRWTGKLQQELGMDYEVIEEGLGGRVTSFDDPTDPSRNGLTYLPPCIKSHIQVDYFIVCLGTNDLKERYNYSPEQIAANFEKLLIVAKEVFLAEQNFLPQLIVMSPPIVDESVPGVEERYRGAGKKSRQLGSLYRSIATKHNAEFIDLARLVSPSKDDGYHLDAAEHEKVAKSLVDLISKN